MAPNISTLPGCDQMRRFLLLLVVLIAGWRASAEEISVWKGGEGSWADAGRWKEFPPTDLRTVMLGGVGEITVPPGRFAAGMMRQGIRSGDDLRLRIQGELVVRRDFVQVGEYRGSSAQIVLADGHCMPSQPSMWERPARNPNGSAWAS